MGIWRPSTPIKVSDDVAKPVRTLCVARTTELGVCGVGVWVVWGGVLVKDTSTKPV